MSRKTWPGVWNNPNCSTKSPLVRPVFFNSYNEPNSGIPPFDGALLQEDGFLLLQEDGSLILLEGY